MFVEIAAMVVRIGQDGLARHVVEGDVLRRQLGVEAITTQWRSRSGYMMDHASACMPPSEPPMTAANCLMPSASARRACAATQSSTVTTGKAAPMACRWPGWCASGRSSRSRSPGC
jgi:hypothetical protein